MNKYQKILMKAMLHGYSLLVIGETKDEHTGTVWYKQALEVNKYFSKRRPDKVPTGMHEFLDKQTRINIEMDAEFFDGKDFSAYACMFSILQYLIIEERDTELRVRFGHYDFNGILKELDEIMPDIEVQSNKFIGKLTDRIGKLDV